MLCGKDFSMTDPDRDAREERALQGDDKRGGDIVGWIVIGVVVFWAVVIWWLI